MTKYPGGTPDRWVRISKEMGRSISEITAKAKAARGDVGKIVTSPNVCNNRVVEKLVKRGS